LFDIADKILEVSIHQFPADQRFLELLYIRNNDRAILARIQKGKFPLRSFLRLYNRVDKDIPKLVLEILIKRILKTLKIDDLKIYQGNYEILPILFNIIPKESFSGVYVLDTDSDTFSDTFYKISDGVIQYKGLDRDGDNVIDYEFFLKDGIPKSVIIDKSIMHYGQYPFIDYISISDPNSRRVTYNLYKNFTKKKLTTLTDEPDSSLVVSEVPRLKVISKIYYYAETIMKQEIFRSDNTVLVYSEQNLLGKFDKCLLMKDNIIISGLRDMNSDGIYDLNEIYNHGVLVGNAYSPSGTNEDISYLESYTGNDLSGEVDFNWWHE